MHSSHNETILRIAAFLCLLSLSGCTSTSPERSTGSSATENNSEESAPKDNEEVDATQSASEDVADKISVGPWRVDSLGSAPASSGLSIAVEEGVHSQVTVKVYASQLNEVFGLAFRLRYDADRLEFLESSAEDLLSNPLAQGHYVITQREPGLLIYGGARFHPPANFQSEITGINLDRSLVATVLFQPLNSGETTVAFDERGRDLRDINFEPIETDWTSARFALRPKPAGGR